MPARAVRHPCPTPPLCNLSEGERGAWLQVFVVNPAKKLALSILYPATTGRNFDELLRVVDSLQRTAQHKVATPANWTPGDAVIIVPSLSDTEAAEAFPGFETLKPYLRTTPDPR